MLVADDDDHGLDGLEAFEEEDRQAREAALAASDAASQPIDEEPLPDVVTREDFVLLPLVTKLLRARADGPDALDAAMAELRRGVRRADRMVGILEGTAPSGVRASDVEPAMERLRDRTALLERFTRKRSLADIEDVATK